MPAKKPVKVKARKKPFVRKPPPVLKPLSKRMVVKSVPGALTPLQFVRHTLRDKYDFQLWGTSYSKLVRVGNKRLASEYQVMGFVTDRQKPTLRPRDFSSTSSVGAIRMLNHRRKGIGREVTTAELSKLFAKAATLPTAAPGFIRVSYGHLRTYMPGFMSFRFKITPRKTPYSITSDR